MLSRKLLEQSIVVLDGFPLEGHKTRDLIARLGKLGIEGKALLVDSRENHNLSLAARNVRALKAVDALAVNVYDVVDRPYLVLSEDALARLVEVLAK